MDEKNNKKEIVAVLGLILIFILIIGVTYAAFTYAGKGSKENTITTGTVRFIYNETSNGISINNAFPMTDKEGKLLSDEGDGITKGFFDFNVEATLGAAMEVQYYVYAVDITDSNSNKLDPSFVKMYLTDAGSPEQALVEFMNKDLR